LAKRSVAVRISGQEYRIRSEADEAWLHRVAQCVDVAMTQIRERTGTVDSLDVAILTSLNLAREVLALRARAADAEGSAADVGDDRLRALIVLAETAIERGTTRGFAVGGRRDGGETSLLTLPAGDEVDELEGGIFGPLMEVIEAAGASPAGGSKANSASAKSSS
jgi:cell division protein ZapA (FtsZ GTPase activity inhibitor)